MKQLSIFCRTLTKKFKKIPPFKKFSKQERKPEQKLCITKELEVSIKQKKT